MRQLWSFVISFLSFLCVHANEDAKRLYDDLMVNYNRHRRPATGPHEPLTIKLKLRLSQIIDVHEIDQIMTCSVWLKQVWIDKKLSWDPKSYGGVSVLYVPYEMIWVPDIVLYNNADSNYNITISTKATLHYSGEVTWEPPAIFKSMCQIDVRWFPFDEQQCHLKHANWLNFFTMAPLSICDSQAHSSLLFTIDIPKIGKNPAHRVGSAHYQGYNHNCRRLTSKPIWFPRMLHLAPWVLIRVLKYFFKFLYGSREHGLSFFAVYSAFSHYCHFQTEIIPATSITLPLIGKYLLFTMVMVTLSVVVTVISLNLHFRTPTTHLMPKWVKLVFLKWLPKILFMRRPLDDGDDSFKRVSSRKGIVPTTLDGKIPLNLHEHRVSRDVGKSLANAAIDDRIQKLYYSPQVVKAFENICFIAELLKKKDRDDKIDEDWKYVAMVLDRLFLLIFSFACFIGTVLILLQAPTLYDDRRPIDLQYRPANLSALF
ncbi:Cation transporter family protein [Teladorsagia circumcincta]|uniref:Cation transporter family protein n=1 Tax=Teladorsagia circumcincta TaxID=45464 RepID=A0A2G9UXA2_TELCI|nr:Cation transporter family protein [Teladorsagia circumcincta]